MLILIKYIFSETKTTFSGTAGTLASESPQAIYEAKQDCHNQSNKTTQTTRNDLTAQVYSTLLKSNPNIFYDKCIKSDLNTINC